MNDIEYPAYFLAMALELVNHLGGLLNVAGQPGDAVAGQADDLPTAGCFAVGPGRDFGGALCIECDVLHAGTHLLDRRSDQVGFLLLA